MTQPLLIAQNLCKTYEQHLALSHVSLRLQPGRVIGLLGPNGSGKTTFLKLAAGLLTPTAGTLTIGGYPIGPETKRIVSYLPERNSLPLWMNAADAVSFFETMFDDFDRAAAVSMLERLDVPSDRPIKAFSKGMREKIQIVLVMSRRAQLYLLDEPLGGVDPASREFILSTVIQQAAPHAAILFSTHLIRDVEPYLDEFIFLRQGEVIRYDATKTVTEQEGRSLDELFREVFQC